MIRLKPAKMLVVAAPTSSVPIPPKKEVLHIANAERIFPVIHELQPDTILLDYNYLGAQQTERVLRRLTGNAFYHKIKIHCYKPTPHTKTDDLLKVLGVHVFVYDAQPKQKRETAKLLREMIEAHMIVTLAEAGY